MGGMGSGRKKTYANHQLTESFRHVDVRRWKREGLLDEYHEFRWCWRADGQVQAFIDVYAQSDQVVLSYRHRIDNEPWQSVRCAISLTWTACALGGSRPWFVCPIRGCGRKVAILYLDDIPACRHCLGLSYASQRESAQERAERKARAICDAVGWDYGLFVDRGKPKGMHWRTYDRYLNAYNAAKDRSWMLLCAKHNIPIKRAHFRSRLIRSGG